MVTLQEKLVNNPDFLLGVELVSVRGPISSGTAGKALAFGMEMATVPAVDWISVTDNAGGNPQLAPRTLGAPILKAGKDVVIHLTCKDLNRNALESEAWSLESEGFRNILAMTGDYPVSGMHGNAKPVFDTDSVGLITMLNQMNSGLQRTSTTDRLPNTRFFIGAVVSNFKYRESEVMPQYFKLAQKVKSGARFIINQIGFDSRKIHELRVYMNQHGMESIPLIGNVYVLNSRVVKLFYKGNIPGVVVTGKFHDDCLRHVSSPDKGKKFFQELAAKQMAVYHGLGYRGAYLGGVHDAESVNQILEIEKTFSADDWKQFAREIRYNQPGEYYYYGEDETTGLADGGSVSQETAPRSKHVTTSYRFSKWIHDVMFLPESGLAKWGAKRCRNAKDSMQGPAWLRKIELASKASLFECRDCGDCSLPEIAFLCPESQCAKNQRNGPCGGTRPGGKCEVEGYGDCIWVRAYERLKSDGKEKNLLGHSPVIQDQRLRGTSAWANSWLGRDHAANPVQHTGGITHPEEPVKPQQNKQKEQLSTS